MLGSGIILENIIFDREPANDPYSMKVVVVDVLGSNLKNSYVF